MQATRTNRRAPGLLAAALLLTLAPGCTRQAPVVLAVDDVVASTGLVEQLVELAGGAGAVTVVPGSTGDCLLLGAQGRADVLLVAAPAEVERLGAQGRVADSTVPFHNEYALVGRETDPAGAARATDGALAMRLINRSGSSFSVPGRGSAARFKLEELWKLQTDTNVSPGFLGVAGGMRETVMNAHAQGTYALVDRATRLTYLQDKGLKPRVLLRGGAEMGNPYQLVLLTPGAGRQSLAPRARALFDALRGAAAQKLVASFGVNRYGEPLFDAGPVRGDVVTHRQLPQAGDPAPERSPLLPSAAPLRPGAELLPNPHGLGGLPMGAPHGPGGMALGPGGMMPGSPHGGGMMPPSPGSPATPPALPAAP